MNGWGSLLTLLTFILHVAAGCCAHHGHAAADQPTAVQSERCPVRAHSQPPATVEAVHLCTCGASHSGSPRPCRETTCRFWISPESRPTDSVARSVPTPASFPEPPFAACRLRWGIVQIPVVLQTGCPVSVRSQPWLQAWLT